MLTNKKEILNGDLMQGFAGGPRLPKMQLPINGYDKNNFFKVRTT
jgi:hypothetical protein